MFPHWGSHSSAHGSCRGDDDKRVHNGHGRPRHDAHGSARIRDSQWPGFCADARKSAHGAHNRHGPERRFALESEQSPCDGDDGAGVAASPNLVVAWAMGPTPSAALAPKLSSNGRRRFSSPAMS